MGKLSRTHTIALAVVIAAAVAVPIAIAQSTDEGATKERHGQWQEHGGRDHGRMGGAFFRNLDLTDAQKAQMKQIRESHKQNLLPVMKDIRSKRHEIRQASQSGTFNEALVTQKLTEIAPLEAKLMGEQFKLHQEMLSVLTPGQKSKLDQTREQFKEKRAERHANKEKTQ